MKPMDKIEVALVAAAEKAGPGVPLLVNSSFYMDMRSLWAKSKDNPISMKPFNFEQEARKEYLAARVFAKWEGRWIFLSPNKDFGVPARDHDPEPYPEGLKAIEELERKDNGGDDERDK